MFCLMLFVLVWDKMDQDGVLLRYSVNDLIYSSRLHVARGSI